MGVSTTLPFGSQKANFSLQENTMVSDESGPDPLQGRPDKELFLRKTLQQDPRKGCSLLFRQYFAPLCSHAVRFVYSREIAEDLVAQVFCDFWEYRLYEQIQHSCRAFLYTMVRNRSVDYLRKELGKSSSQAVSSVSLATPQLHPEQQMAFDELSGAIQQTVEGLPPQCRKVFLLSRFEGKKNKEIAESLQISQRTVETHISKALATLRQVVKDTGFLLIGLLTLLLPF